MKAASGGGRKTVARLKPRAQYAALPFRLTPDLEILLVTSRETARWVIPKGWPMKARKGREVAAIEALEEAGVEGRLLKGAAGVYEYSKVLRSGDSQQCRVRVYALEVLVQRETWREQDQRSSQWFSSEAAADVVREPGLSRIIRQLATKIASNPGQPLTFGKSKRAPAPDA